MLMPRANCSHNGKKTKNDFPRRDKYNYGAIFLQNQLPLYEKLDNLILENKVLKAFEELQKNIISKKATKEDIIHFACQIRYTENKLYLEKLFRLAKKHNLFSVPLYGIMFNYFYNNCEHNVIIKIYERLDIYSQKDLGITCIYLNALRKLKQYHKAIKFLNILTETNYMIENQIGLDEYFCLLIIKAYCLKDYENENRERIYLNESFDLFKYILKNINKKHDKYTWALCGFVFCINDLQRRTSFA